MESRFAPAGSPSSRGGTVSSAVGSSTGSIEWPSSLTALRTGSPSSPVTSASSVSGPMGRRWPSAPAGGSSPCTCIQGRRGLRPRHPAQLLSPLAPARFLPDPLVNASWVRTPAIFIDGRTFVDGVSILPRGSHTELAPGRAPRTGSYWDPRPDVGEEPEPSPEHPRELRRILIETLSRDLDPEGRNLLMLSGGVDSSALGALAAGTLGRGLSSWSMIPASEPGRSRELSYIDPARLRFGIQPARKRELTEEIHRRWISAAPGLPFQILHPALCDLPNVCAEQEVRVLVSGMFADEVCGDRQRMNDWVLHTSVRSLLSESPLPFGRPRLPAMGGAKASRGDRSPAHSRHGAGRVGAAGGRGRVSRLGPAPPGRPRA